ncbi:hypothetical protein Fot_25160 [Forsythia ovata]|uniref:Uncharacterized protein n=1 Tax=Forsythia ovata TaxID=205694 RepID=A0ABD1U8E3_9LAMI
MGVEECYSSEMVELRKKLHFLCFLERLKLQWNIVEGEADATVDTEVRTTVEGEAEAVVDTWVRTTEEGDAEEVDQPRRWTTQSVRRKDAQEKPKVFLRRSKKKSVEKPDVDEQPLKTRVKKPLQWVTSPYTTES